MKIKHAKREGRRFVRWFCHGWLIKDKFQPFWWILWRLGEDLAMTWQYHLPGFDCDVIGWSLKFGLTWVSSNDGGEHSHTIWYRHHLLWSQSFGDIRLDTYEWTA